MPTNEPVTAPEPAKQEATPQPATLAELQAFASGEPGFIVSALERGLTVTAAQAEYIARQAQQLGELRQAGPAPTGGPGLDGGKPAAAPLDFLDAARARAAEKKIPLARAMSELVKENPEAHKAWVESQSQKK